MHVDSKTVAQHSKRIADTPLSVKRIANRKRMNQITFSCKRLLRTSGQNPTDIRLFDFMTAQIDTCREGFAPETPSRNIHDKTIDRQTSHTLRRIDRKADRLFGSIKVDNDAGLDAA